MKHNNILPFPLLQNYLSNINFFHLENIFNFYKYSFLDIDNSEQEKFVGNISNSESPSDLISDNDITRIL